MAYTTFVGLAMMMGVFGWILLILAYDTYSQFKPPQVVHCPASDTPAALEVAFDRQPVPQRVVRCSHWPERGGCNQSCLRGHEGLGA